jgi:hypothetical protein
MYCSCSVFTVCATCNFISNAESYAHFALRVQCTLWLFPVVPRCVFTGMLIGYILNDVAMVAVSPVTTGITSVFTFHMRFVCSVRSLLLDFFLVHIYYNNNNNQNVNKLIFSLRYDDKKGM